ncbi:outer membrane beta-barrel protein [uncultured Alistipes sp.]|uniref:outer membrane beta-barrel protein n=1 Tax=uncultured Alistipes sp. TaxID=538949 RepID=UPI00272A1FE6|nr:outer membrane beta-barrel protein [uncultured Alistipes sp.]
MFRKLLFSLLFVSAAAAAAAQPLKVEWGVMAGINVPDYKTDMEMADIKNKLGWQAGIVTSLKIGWVSVDPQIFYVRQGLRIRPEGGGELNLKSNSIDAPVLVSFRPVRFVRIFAGPVFTAMNSCKQKVGADRIDFGRIRPTLSYSVGAGVTLFKHLAVDLRYNGRFKAKSDVVLPDGRQLDRLRTYNVALNVGYLF